jgi:hypothetical protein
MFFALRLKNAMVMLQITKSSTRQNPSLHLKRCLSATDIFTPLKHSPADQLLQTQPKMVPELSVGDLYASGQSVLHDLDLFWPISPSSWVRLGLESLHNFSEIPWWLTFLISVTITNQNYVFY